MNKNEIEHIISNPKNMGKVLSDLTDQFREGKDPWGILKNTVKTQIKNGTFRFSKK